MGGSACQKAYALMRILLPLHGFIGWNGGLDLVRLLVSAIGRASARNDIEIYFAGPRAVRTKRVLFALLRRWREIHAGRLGAFNGSAAGLLKTAAEITTGHPVVACGDDRQGLLQAAEFCNADIVFPTMFPLGHTTIPRIGYIFDFQHRHIPDFFPERIKRNRDRHFAEIAEDANGIVVNSLSVARDVEEILGISKHQILAMPFAPYALPWWFDLDPVATAQRYKIHAPYLLICNHFWKHKDHAAALHAFVSLRGQFTSLDLQLAMTGDPIDHRDPAHYSRLLATTSELGIAHCTHFLGLIPKRDQLALLRGCAVLLQPTLFEGGPGGGSVYEAIGLGVPSVVSDIPVNREINQGDVRFFHAGDSTDLAEKIAQVLTNCAPRPARDALLVQGDANLTRLGNAITGFLERFVNVR